MVPLHCLHKNHQGAVNELSKAHINGRKEYPADLEAALSWITEHTEVANDSHSNMSKLHKSNSHANRDDGTKNVTSFTQVAEPADKANTANNQSDTSSTISISRARYKMRKPGVSWLQMIRAHDSDEEE